MIAVLEKQLSLFAEREKVYLEQIDLLSVRLSLQFEQLDRLLIRLEEQTKRIQSLEDSLLLKQEDITALSGKNRGLSKLLNDNVSEKHTPIPDTSGVGEVTAKKQYPTPKERGYNQAKRKEHFGMQEQLIEIWSESQGFEKSKAYVIGYVDSIRYSYQPCRFKKTICRQYTIAGQAKR